LPESILHKIIIFNLRGAGFSHIEFFMNKLFPNALFPLQFYTIFPPKMHSSLMHFFQAQIGPDEKSHRVWPGKLG